MAQCEFLRELRGFSSRTLRFKSLISLRGERQKSEEEFKFTHYLLPGENSSAIA